MWSMCSIETGHSCTHAPQVTQSQTTSSVTALGTSGESAPPSSEVWPSANNWSRMPMIRSFGESAFPVAKAGQTSWQRPHSVHDIASSICFHVRSATVPAPKRIEASSPDLEVERLEPASRSGPPEEDVDRGSRDVQVLRVREVREEAEDDEHVRPHEDALEDLGGRVVAEESRQRVRHGRPARRPGVQIERDERRVPEDQRRDDPRDQQEDEIRFTEVRALEPAGSLNLANSEGSQDTEEHERCEDVDEERVPALALEPPERRARRQRLLAIDDRRDRHEDRREEDEEAPEDEGVHEAGAEPLQQLPLAEDDGRLVADALWDVRDALDGLARAHEPEKEERPPSEQPARDPDRNEERECGRGAGGRAQPLAFRSSAEIAGTTSCRSPMTA